MDRIEKRRIGWDILRIVFAGIVFAFHANIHLHLTFGLLTDYVSVGAFCMTGFFMLSGAVLYLKYGEKTLDKSEILEFYQKRLKGILPLYFVVMFLFYLDNPFTGDDALLLPIEILGLQSLFPGSFSIGHNSGTWFVSCLLVCYFIFPLINEIIIGMRTRTMIILGVCLGVFDIYAQLITGNYGFGELYSAPFLRCIQFVIGCIVCSVIRRKTTKLHNSTIIIGLICCTVMSGALITWMVQDNSFQGIAYLQKLAMYDIVVVPCFIITIYLAGQLTVDKSIVGRVLGNLSGLSYAFFLAQFFVWDRAQEIFLRYKITQNKIKVVIAFLLCIVITALLHFAFEKPIQYVLKRKKCK